MSPPVRIHPDLESLSRAAAEHFVALATEAVSKRGRFAVALSGGSTPRETYTLLASPAFAPLVPWTQVHVFWGDERCVPPDHPDSNYRMAWETLLRHLPIPRDHIHRMVGEIDPPQAAGEYEEQLRAFFAHSPEEPGLPRFDLVLLGMGRDGHTASLFPKSEALREAQRWVVAQEVEPQAAWRLTLTPIAINATRQVIFLVAGQEKAEALREVLEGSPQPERLPAQAIRPDSGHLLWLVDAGAASLLSQDPGGSNRRRDPDDV